MNRQTPTSVTSDAISTQPRLGGGRVDVAELRALVVEEGYTALDVATYYGLETVDVISALSDSFARQSTR